LYLRQNTTDFRDSALWGFFSLTRKRCQNFTEKDRIFVELRVFESKGVAAARIKAKIAFLAISSSIFIRFSSRDDVSKGLRKTQLLKKVSFESD